MGEFTPGPWTMRAVKPYRIEDSTVYVDHDAPHQHFTVWRVFRDEQGRRTHWPVAEASVVGDHREIAEANARLIAAAPELLDACFQAMALHEDDEGITAVLRAAIARATTPAN